MRLAVRTIVVVLLGVVVGIGLFLWLQPTYGQFLGAQGMNPNFASLVSVWQALGGTAAPLSAEQLQGASGGMPPFAGGGGGGSGFGGGFGGGPGGGGPGAHDSLADGLNLAAAPRQTGSDLLWIAVPAVLGAVIELAYRASSRRKRPRPARPTGSRRALRPRSVRSARARRDARRAAS